MLYGTPRFDIDKDVTDRIGIRTLTVSKFWQAASWTANTVDPQLDPNFPGAPPVSAGVVLIGQQTTRKGGGFKTSWTFEGVNGNGQSVTFKTKGNSLDFQFDPGFSQVSVMLLPNFQALLSQFGGSVVNAGDVIWPQTLPSGSGSGAAGLGGGGGSGTPQTNPMFGQQDFLRLEGTYSYRYAAFDPAASQAGTATIFPLGSLPGLSPTGYTDGRNWLKAPAPYRRRGPVYDITEIYWLSGPGGWPEPIYGASGSGSGGTGDFSINAANSASVFSSAGLGAGLGASFGGALSVGAGADAAAD